jgi:hypothetical protein
VAHIREKRILEGKNYLEDLGIDGKVIIKFILKK